MSCLIAVSVNFSTFLVIGKTSPVTYQVLGHLKTCLVLGFGYTLLHDPFTERNIIGITIAVFGMGLYSYFCTNETKKKIPTGELSTNSQVIYLFPIFIYILTVSTLLAKRLVFYTTFIKSKLLSFLSSFSGKVCIYSWLVVSPFTLHYFLFGFFSSLFPFLHQQLIDFRYSNSFIFLFVLKNIFGNILEFQIDIRKIYKIIIWYVYSAIVHIIVPILWFLIIGKWYT